MNQEHLDKLNEGVDAFNEWRQIDLRGASLSGVYLAGINLSDATLTGANLAGATLTGANLSGADLSEANLTEADLRDADLNGADLSEANLTGSDLTDADLRYANLRNANLSDADLVKADLSDADLTAANLTGANLTGANLTDTDLTGSVDDGRRKNHRSKDGTRAIGCLVLIGLAFVFFTLFSNYVDKNEIKRKESVREQLKAANKEHEKFKLSTEYSTPTSERTGESNARAAFVDFTENVLFANDPKREIIRDAKLNGNKLILYTTPYFDAQSYRFRLQSVEVLWNGWAGAYSKHSNQEPRKDNAHLELRDRAGLEVGGTSSRKGSWVVQE